MLHVRLPRLHAGQAPVHQHPARFKILACGRRFGKTRLGVRAALETALQGYPAWWTAPTYDLTQPGWRLLERMTRRIPGGEVHKGDRICALPGGGWVEVRTASDPDGLRGEGLKRVVLDEAAYMQEAAWTRALRPALSDLAGDAWFLSSPAGRNWFYRLYLRGLDPLEPEYASWNLPTSANPTIAPTEIAQARRDLLDRWFRQEYLAEFLDDSGAVFRKVRAAIAEDAAPSGPVHVGMDLGRTLDATVLIALQGGHVVAMDRFDGVAWELQFGRLAAFLERWQPAVTLIESNFNDSFVERAQQQLPHRIEAFRTTADSKRQAIDGLALAIENGELTYPDLPVLVNELEAFEYGKSPTGKPTMSAPSGGHDDCVMALALARTAALLYPAPGSFRDAARRPVLAGTFAGVRGR